MKTFYKKMHLMTGLTLLTIAVQAQPGVTQTPRPGFGWDANIILAMLAIFLLVPISSLANAFVMTAKNEWPKTKTH